MRLFKKRKKRDKPIRRASWWRSLDLRRSWQVMRLGLLAVLAASGVLGATMAMARLDAHVAQQLLARADGIEVFFVDLPADLTPLTRGDLASSINDLLSRNWTEESLCRDMAERLSSVAWIRRIHSVRRLAYGRFEVSADYRVPVASVQRADAHFLVDAEGVRLPGVYVHDPRFVSILGVAESAPAAGEVWIGEDLRAGLVLGDVFSREPYRRQITGVSVENFAGRVRPSRSHIELITDRPEGRIRWGSAPGREVEENTVVQKLGILRANFRRTGRIDAGHAVIDVSTFPDRFTIPG